MILFFLYGIFKLIFSLLLSDILSLTNLSHYIPTYPLIIIPFIFSIILMQQVQNHAHHILTIKTQKNSNNQNLDSEFKEEEGRSSGLAKLNAILQKPYEQRFGSEINYVNQFIQENIFLNQVVSKVSKQFVRNIMKKAKLSWIPKNRIIALQGSPINNVGILLEGKVSIHHNQAKEGSTQIQFAKEQVWNELLNKSSSQIKYYKQKMASLKTEEKGSPTIYQRVEDLREQLELSEFQYSIAQNQEYGLQDRAVGGLYLNSYITEDDSAILLIKQEDLIIHLEQALKDKIKLLTSHLKSIKCFSFLESDKINPIIQNLHLHRFKKGDKIYSQGDPTTQFFLLNQGEVKLTKTSDLFQENPNQLYFNRTKLFEKTFYKSQKSTEMMNKQEMKEFTQTLRKSQLPYANLKSMYNFRPAKKNIEIGILTPFCLFGEEEFLEDKPRQTTAICSSLNCQFYNIKTKKIQDIIGQKIWPKFKADLEASFAKKVLYRQSQFASNLEFQNKTNMNYFYLKGQQQISSSTKLRIKKFNQLLESVPSKNSPNRSFSRQFTKEAQRKSFHQTHRVAPRYTALNFNKMMAKSFQKQNIEDQQQIEFKDEKQLKIMGVSHSWRLMQKKIQLSERTSRRISPVKPVININKPLIEAEYFYHSDSQKKRVEREHRKRVLSLGRSTLLRRGSNSSVKKQTNKL